MQPLRRCFLRLVCAAAALPVATIAAAQTYPTRPVRIIVPFAAGGPATVLAHVIAQPLSETFGQSFYVENLPTGASNVGTTTAAKAPADGHTLLVVTPSFVINPSLYARLAYDPIRDFTPVILAVTSPHVLIVNPSFPANNVAELVALAKANPGKYSYASAGTGQSAQLAAERFNRLRTRHRACAFQRRCSGDEFDRRRTYADRIQCLALGRGAHQGRQAACARGDERRARPGISRCADPRGSGRPGAGIAVLPGRRCSGWNAEGDHPPTLSRDRQDSGAAAGEGAHQRRPQSDPAPDHRYLHRGPGSLAAE